MAYEADGRVRSITPNQPGVPAVVTKAIIQDMNDFAPPTNFVVPMVGAIQDPGQHRGAAGLRPGLPVLPGGLPLPAPCASGTPGC